VTLPVKRGWFVRRRAVFQGLPGGLFRGSCRARRPAGRGASCSSSERAPGRTLGLSLSLSLSLLAASPRSSAIRHMDAHEERLLRRTRKRPRESSSRFASLVKPTRDFAYRTASRLPLPSRICCSFRLFPVPNERPRRAVRSSETSFWEEAYSTEKRERRRQILREPRERGGGSKGKDRSYRSNPILGL